MVLSLLIGFMLGCPDPLLDRSDRGLLRPDVPLPTVLGLLATSQQRFHDLQPWIDIQFAQSGLFVFEQALTGEQWANIAVTGSRVAPPPAGRSGSGS